MVIRDPLFSSSFLCLRLFCPHTFFWHSAFFPRCGLASLTFWIAFPNRHLDGFLYFDFFFTNPLVVLLLANNILAIFPASLRNSFKFSLDFFFFSFPFRSPHASSYWPQASPQCDILPLLALYSLVSIGACSGHGPSPCVFPPPAQLNLGWL